MAFEPMATAPLPVLPTVPAAAAPVGVLVEAEDPVGGNVPVEADVSVEADLLCLLTGRTTIPGVPGRSTSSSDSELE